MLVQGTPTRTIRPVVEGGKTVVEIIDQTRLPHEFVLRRLATPEDAAEAIAVMRVRGAPLIGATAAYGMALAADRDASDDGMAGRASSLSPPAPRPSTCAGRGTHALAPVAPAGERALTRRLDRGGGDPVRG
jgi:methylthioribose-1-phosphate isomerase